MNKKIILLIYCSLSILLSADGRKKELNNYVSTFDEPVLRINYLFFYEYELRGGLRNYLIRRNKKKTILYTEAALRGPSQEATRPLRHASNYFGRLCSFCVRSCFGLLCSMLGKNCEPGSPEGHTERQPCTPTWKKEAERVIRRIWSGFTRCPAMHLGILGGAVSVAVWGVLPRYYFARKHFTAWHVFVVM